MKALRHTDYSGIQLKNEIECVKKIGKNGKIVVKLLDRDQRKSNILQSRHLNILKVDTFMTK